MRVHTSGVLAVFALALAATPARAQETTDVDVTPYVAVGTAGAPPVGVAVTLPITSSLRFETDVAYRRGEGRINALSANGSLLWFPGRLGALSPYVAGGVGLAQFGTPVLPASGPPIGTQSRIALTVNAGGGVKMPLNDALRLRMDARWYKSFGQESSEQFHVAEGLSFRLKR